MPSKGNKYPHSRTGGRKTERVGDDNDRLGSMKNGLARLAQANRVVVDVLFAHSKISWDNPTMATATADAKRRVVLPAVSPGDIFDIQRQGEGRLLLVRLEPPKPEPQMSLERCLEVIAETPLRPTMTWEDLKAMTREP